MRISEIDRPRKSVSGLGLRFRNGKIASVRDCAGGKALLGGLKRFRYAMTATAITSMAITPRTIVNCLNRLGSLREMIFGEDNFSLVSLVSAPLAVSIA